MLGRMSAKHGLDNAKSLTPRRDKGSHVVSSGERVNYKRSVKDSLWRRFGDDGWMSSVVGVAEWESKE